MVASTIAMVAKANARRERFRMSAMIAAEQWKVAAAVADMGSDATDSFCQSAVQKQTVW